MNMGMNPRVLHVLLEVGQVASLVSSIASFAGPFTSALGPYAPVVGGISAAAGGYLTWLKSVNVGNIPAANSASTTQTKS
jgi:hypothetical protein